MAFTKVTNVGIASTGTVLLQDVNATGIVTAGLGVSTVDGFFSGVTTTSTLKSTAITGSGVLTLTDTTESTSTTTGAVIISGGVGIAKTLHVGGSVSIGGTLTYEDVTNIDSVGLITARKGINVSGGHISLGDSQNIYVGVGSDLKIYHDGSDSYVNDTGTGDLKIKGSVIKLLDTNNNQILTTATDGGIVVKHNNNTKLQTSNTGITVTGTVSATTGAFTNVTGDGSALTGVSAGKFKSDALGITTNTAVGIQTSGIEATRIAGTASSFRGMWIGDGYIGFPTTLDNGGGYYISTFTNALSAGPVALSTTMTLDGTWVVV